MLRMMEIEGRDCPVATCDVCHTRILDGTDGVYCWAKDETGALVEQGRILVVHARCRNAFEQANAHLYWSHLPLECLPIAFGDRLNLNWITARERTERLTGT